MGKYKKLILFSVLSIIINFNLFIKPFWGFFLSLVIFLFINLVIWKVVKWFSGKFVKSEEDADWIAAIVVFIICMYGYGTNNFVHWIAGSDFVKMTDSAWKESMMRVYKVLYYALLAGLPFVFLFVIKQKWGKQFLSFFLSFSLIIVLFDRVYSYYTTYKDFTPKEQVNIQDERNAPLTLLKPDIYYFVMDGYTGNDALKKYWSFDNIEFTQKLASLNFKVANNAKGNIAATIGAISFVLNLSTFNHPYLFGHNMDLTVHKSIKKNVLFEILKKNGYTIHTNSIFFEETPYFFAQADMHPNAIFFSNFLTRHFVFRAVLKGVNVLTKSTFNDKEWNFEYDRRIAAAVEYQINHVSKEPGFYYNHFMITHPPYRYTYSGKQLDFNNEQTKGNYLDQVKYNNNLLLGYFEALISKYEQLNKPLLIISQSDHGSRELLLKEEEGQIQLMVYDSQNKIDAIKEDEDAVNLMRTVVNTYFGYTLPRQEYEYYNRLSN